MREKQHSTSLFSVTAHYVAEAQTGQQPRLSDYLVRFPQYATEIVNFVAYYHAYEEPTLPAAPFSVPAARRLSPQVMSSIFITATGQQLTPAWLAEHLDLSPDILSLMERRAILPATIPQTLYLKLASLLQLPVDVVRAYLCSRGPIMKPVRDASPRQKVAEMPGRYSPSGVDARFDFRVALEESPEASTRQKQHWLTILADEEKRQEE